MIERRKVQRGRTFLGGSIEYGHPGFTIECKVRDLSPNGAKVVFSDAIPVPNDVDLVIARHGKTRRVRFVWRRKQEAGVVFLDAELNTGVSDAPMDASVISLAKVRERKATETDRDWLQARIDQITRDL